MQNAGIAELGLNWRYTAFEVLPEELPAALAGARAMRFVGLNLTVPHKLHAVKLVDELDESAKKWGAVNTICFETRARQGQWIPLGQATLADLGEIRSHGYNTDADAIVRSLREDLDLNLEGARIVLLGAGGAGGVAALKLAESGVRRLHLINRTRSKAEAVAREIRSRHPGVEVDTDYPANPVDLILNATSLGLRSGDVMPLDEGKFSFKKAGAAYDMIYQPAETPFLRQARAAGCRTANGVGMLLYQGVKALEIWSGRKPPVESMRTALLKNVYGGEAPERAAPPGLMASNQAEQDKNGCIPE